MQLPPESGRPRPVVPLPASEGGFQRGNTPSMQKNIRERASLPTEEDEEEYGLEQDLPDSEMGVPPLPVPELSAQPLQRPPTSGRSIRRLDRNSELVRGSRNAPSGDVIDIPAFLRRR